MSRLITILLSSFALSSSSPTDVELVDLIPRKMDQTLAFIHSLYNIDNYALATAIDAVSPLIHQRRQELGALSSEPTWNQLVQLQAATSTTLMCLNTMRPFIANKDASSVENLLSEWRNLRGQAIHVVEQTEGTVNELPEQLLDGIHSALAELRDAHSRITERLGNAVEGLLEFKRINALGSFESSRETFEDWAILRIELSTISELRDMLTSAADNADSLAQSAELYNKLSSTIELGREFKKLIIRLRLYLAQIPSSQSQPLSPKVSQTTGDLSVVISGKIGQVLLMFKAVDFLSETEAAMTAVHIEKVKSERSKVAQSSQPDELIMICSSVVVVLELYAEAGIGRRNSWVKLLVSDLMQLRLKAADLLTDKYVAEVPVGLREDARVILVEMRRVIGTIALSAQLGQSSHSFFTLAAMQLDDVAVKKIMFDQASSFLNSLHTVIAAVDGLRTSLPGTRDLKPLIAELRAVLRRTRLVMKKRKNDGDLEEVTQMETESSKIEPLTESADISTTTEEYGTTIMRVIMGSSSEGSNGNVGTPQESITSLHVRIPVQSLDTTAELLDEAEWRTSRHQVRRDNKRLRGGQDVIVKRPISGKGWGVSRLRPNAPLSTNKRGEGTRNVGIVGKQQRQAAATPTSLSMSTRTTQYSPTKPSVMPPTGLPDTTIRQVSLVTDLPSKSLTESAPVTTDFVPVTVSTDRPFQSLAESVPATPNRQSETLAESVGITTPVVSLPEGDLKDSDAVREGSLIQPDHADEYWEEFEEETFWVVPQPVTQIASRIRILSDTLRSISTEIGGLAAGALVSSLDETTRHNVALLCQELTLTQHAIDRLRYTTSGFEAFANELPPVLYPIECPPSI